MKFLLCKNLSFPGGTIAGSTFAIGMFASRMVRPFRAFKRQQRSAAKCLVV